MPPSGTSRHDDLAVWQKRTSRPLSEEDAREIRHNLAGFFSILREWAVADGLPNNNETEVRSKNDQEA